MKGSDCTVHLLHCSEGKLVATDGESEVVRGPHQHIFHLECDLIIDLIQAEVQVLELRALQQVPVSCFVAIGVPRHLALNLVHNRDRLLSLLLLLELLVFLDDGVTLLQLSLIGLNLV